MTISDDEWEQRILCSDGNCIGVVGADGRCNVCGKPYEGDLPLPATDSETMATDVEKFQTIEPVLSAALERVDDFVKQVTGVEPTQAEIADALSRYFVLNEIKDHILMVRGNKDSID